jgi:hypothetical protein
VGVVVGLLAFGIVVAIAATLVIREAGRMAKDPPPTLFDLDDAYEWVVDNVPDVVAATLTPDDVRRILAFQVEYFKRKGVSANGSVSLVGGPVVVGGSETVEYILERAAATGEAYLPEQVYAVVETQLSYLRAIGAIGPVAELPDDPLDDRVPDPADDPETPPT